MSDSYKTRKTYMGFLLHAVFLSITVTFTEVNTVLPALVIDIGGTPFHVGAISAIMIGIPLISKLMFTSFLSKQERKRPWLLLGIYLRVFSLLLIGVTMIYQGQMSFLMTMALVYGSLLLFSLSGAFAGLPYVHIVGGSLGSEIRKRFFTRKQIISSVGMLVSVLAAQYIIRSFPNPLSYQYLFFLAAGFLLLASIGFWMIEEKPVRSSFSMNYLQTIRSIPSILKKDRTFRNYVLLSNILSIILALIPFFIGYAKEQYTIDERQLSYILVVQISGMIISSLIWPLLVKKGGYKRILQVRIILSVMLPIMAVLLGMFGSFTIYLIVVFFVGFVVSARTVSEDAVLIELTEDSSRVLYSGILGTLNMSIIIFPLLIGSVIGFVGSIPVFIAVSIVSLAGIRFLRAMACPVDASH